MKNMAEIIKEQRTAAGLTQEELADKLGLKKSAIAKYENGRVENIKRSTIQDMSTIFGCKPSYLMGWEDENITYSVPEILSYYMQLNNLGKETATEHVRLLTLDKKYTTPNVQEFPTAVQEPPVKYSGLNAAHSRTDIEYTEEERAADEAMIDDDDDNGNF